MIASALVFLEGKKSYILSVLAVTYAISGYFTGHIDWQTALDMIWAGGTVSALRASISKMTPPQL